MSNMTPEQQKLVKARKAARVGGPLIIFGGVILLLFGIFTTYLPTVMSGLVMIAASSLFFVATKKIEDKIHATGI